MSNIWKKIYGIINGALRFGAQGPTVANLGNSTLTIRDSAGTGAVTLDVDRSVQREEDIVASDGRKTLITMQAGASADVPVALPNSKGNNGDVLMTDGNGNLFWNTENQEGVYKYPFTFASASAINLVNMPNNFQVNQIVIDVTTPFTGGAASTLAVGVSGTINKFVDTADSALGLQATFDLEIDQQQVTAAQMIATFTVGGSTAGAGTITVYGTVPK